MEKIYCFGEILWDMLPSGRQPGGAPMNVAYHLNRLGIDASPLTAVGKDYLGDELIAFLRSKDIDTQFVLTNSQPTGQVLVSLNQKNEPSYTIQAPAAWDFIELDSNALSQLVSSAYILIFGSLACRNVVNREILQKLSNKAALKICDINLRAPFYNKDLVHHLFSQTDWIKINHEELALIASWYQDDLHTEQEQANFFLHTFPGIDLILVTRGENGAAYYDREAHYSHPGYIVEVADTIGSGDSFLAMFIFKALAGIEPQECLKYACAMGSIVATHKGATPVVDIDNDLRRLMSN
ncbi:MAG: carbohydrate kinase [Saprospiraceae bacterium]